MAGTRSHVYGASAFVAQTLLSADSSNTNSLEGIDITSIPDRSTCYVNDADEGQRLFRWDQDSTDAPDGTTVVIPSQLTLADPGRWLLDDSGGGGAVTSVTGIEGIVVDPETGDVEVSGEELLPLDGTRSMTGDLDMGSNDINNGGEISANTFNGVALTNGGSVTNYLDETGDYSVPTGTQDWADTLSTDPASDGNDPQMTAGDSMRWDPNPGGTFPPDGSIANGETLLFHRDGALMYVSKDTGGQVFTGSLTTNIS